MNEKAPKDCLMPKWDEIQICHDWKNHIPDEIQLAWYGFYMDQREKLARWAQDLADGEEWE